MIDPALESVFPGNVIECLVTVLPGVDEDAYVLTRPLRPTDPNYSIGVYAATWTPNEDSHEIGHTPAPEATLNNYQIGVQTMIKDSDPERGLTIGTIFARRVLSVLYRNEPLRLALGSLYVEDGASRESMKRFGVRSQRFMSNDIEGNFVFVSVLEFWIETEMS